MPILGVKNSLMKITPTIREHTGFLMRSLPVLAFVVPLSLLYYLYPKTFEATWEGRTYYLFFVWLMLLETILNQEDLCPRLSWKSLKTILFIVSLALPTVFVIGANMLGWNTVILDLAAASGISFAGLMPLAVEYLVFAVLFSLLVSVEYGFASLRNYSITALFVGMIGLVYTVNNLYPWGLFTPFQILVPATTVLAATFLGAMGYTTTITYTQNSREGSLPILSAGNTAGSFSSYKIAWPCSGIDSLLIYSVTILLFLKGSVIPLKQKLFYFFLGAVVTYLINALRIATIFVISIGGGEITTFHDYYGPLFSVSWIISYPLIILASRALWSKIVIWRTEPDQVSQVPPTGGIAG